MAGSVALAGACCASQSQQFEEGAPPGADNNFQFRLLLLLPFHWKRLRSQQQHLPLEATKEAYGKITSTCQHPNHCVHMHVHCVKHRKLSDVRNSECALLSLFLEVSHVCP